ncbi:alpha/beta hydrolase [Rheinheimera sp. SA_1]|uniref:alpha/beta fold hydrolase n=1 Tax=Rheinheimera sp. SA_1 TaxID=1827365 RepID=UPI0007FC8397|nr:alpha/beta hydrolase [Rheinheimera sp. SA_1]OBP16754.1 alpha/beta hydrolase [Rheinheimera sp. SA_1]
MFSQVSCKCSTGKSTLIAVFVGIMASLSSSSEAATSFTVEVQGTGSPVIMIPGLMSDRRVWQQTASELSKTHQLHLVSIAGFAGQPAIEGALLPVVKTELLDYIKTEKLQRPAIIGHSLGAFLAYDLASSAPDTIGKIIAVDGLPFLAPVFTRDSNSTVASMKAQAEGIRNFYAQMQPAQLAATMQQGMEIQARETATRERVQQMGAQSDPKAVGQAIYELLSTDLRDKVGNITQPVLQLGAGGALPSEAMRPAVEALYKQQINKIPQATLVFNWQSRHFMMWDEPVWLLNQINQFLAEK